MNPLFLDSTKPVGDKVVTNVELSHLVVQPGESLFFELTDEFGFVQRFQMKLLATKKSSKMVAEVWLKYQHKYQYRFLLIKEGQQFEASVKKNISAGHVVSEKWQPAENEILTQQNLQESLIDKSDVRHEIFEENVVAEPVKRQRKKGFKKLFETQLFDQLKGLIDDLDD